LPIVKETLAFEATGALHQLFSAVAAVAPSRTLRRNDISCHQWERHSMAQSGDRYWERTSFLMWAMFILWIFFSFVIHMFVGPLNEIQFLGFPLGFYMASQGSLVAFVIMLFLFAKRQDTIDREEGVAED
jgi:putative solute:sodium symporter small subunit